MAAFMTGQSNIPPARGFTPGVGNQQAFYSYYHAYELMLGLRVFRQTGPPQRVDCLAPSLVCHMKMEAPVKCFAQGHNKQVCRLVLHTIPMC